MPQTAWNGIINGSFMGRLRRRRIIETVIAFIAGGVAAVEFVYHIIFHHYHFPPVSKNLKTPAPSKTTARKYQILEEISSGGMG
ncbi:MAG: hypothetical protein AMJ73_00065 [candidate division Zixibacteria bacterium SM1_73]|nr:MAG: hypothetical protein AMJ73_00065 [candidate division Zixibacteria bacterium SM1_73]